MVTIHIITDDDDGGGVFHFDMVGLERKFAYPATSGVGRHGTHYRISIISDVFVKISAKANQFAIGGKLIKLSCETFLMLKCKLFDIPRKTRLNV